MFEKGDYIVYGTNGVCEIKDITTIEMEGIPKGRLYYILNPKHYKDSKIFTPVDSEKTSMRAVMTREEADELIHSIPAMEQLRITNDKLREEQYKQAVRSCDCRDWIRIIKTLHLRRQERLAQGKKTTAMDEKYLRIAEDNLYAELALALELSEEEMEDYITKSIAEINIQN